MRSWVSSLFAIVVAASPAAATPEQAINVEDRLFAITANEVMILRTINDNQGYYQTLQTDTFLIIRSLETGQDISIAPVERAVADGETKTTTYSDIEGGFNPFGVRAAMQAAPFADPLDSYHTVTMNDGLVLARSGDDLTHSARWSDVALQTMISLQKTRAILPVMRAVNGDDPFDPSLIVTTQGCVIDASASVSFLSASENLLVRLACEDIDLELKSVIWVVLPKV